MRGRLGSSALLLPGRVCETGSRQLLLLLPVCSCTSAAGSNRVIKADVRAELIKPAEEVFRLCQATEVLVFITLFTVTL